MQTHRRLPLAILAALVAVSLSAQTPLIDQGRAAIGRGDTAAAITILEKAVAESPTIAEAHFYLGNAYSGEMLKLGMFGAAKYASKIRDEYEKTVALNPKNNDARFSLVQFYAGAPNLMGGSYDKAFEHAKAIKAIDPVAGHRAYAFIYTQQKKADLAKQEFADAIREQPTSPKPHSYFGQYFVNTEKNYTAGFAEFEAALKVRTRWTG
jgi:Tfp pilus assembly protein PilF